MGFPHDKTTHHFRLCSDGGAIEVTANDGNDAAKVAALESGESEVLTQYLSAMARFHHYSFGNIGIGVADLGSACCRYSGTGEKTGDPGGCGCYVPVFYRIALRRGYGITSATPVPVRDELSTPTDSVMVVRCSYGVADNEFVPMPAYKDGRSGTPCEANPRGLLQRAHVVAGEIRYVGKETDRKWEGDEISVLDFAATEYGRSAGVIAGEEIKNKILEIGVNKCARESGFDRKNFIRKLVRGVPVKRNSYSEFLCWLQSYELAK